LFTRESGDVSVTALLPGANCTQGVEGAEIALDAKLL